MIKAIYIFFTGILMGIADLLPGISGSTITYILGIYDEFITSLSDIFTSDKFKHSLFFLLKLGSGWLLGAILCVILLGKFADENIYFITSLFIGLIISTIVMTINNLRVQKQANFNFIYILIGHFVTIAIFIFGKDFVGSLNGFGLYLYIFLIGILAISCMLLPGMSGSTVLLIFGLYYPIIKTLNEFLSGDFSNFSYFFVLVIGCISGLLLSSRLISRLLKSKKNETENFILGVLIASIVPIVYSPTTIKESTYAPLGLLNISFVGVMLGIIILVVLFILRRAYDQKK